MFRMAWQMYYNQTMTIYTVDNITDEQIRELRTSADLATRASCSAALAIYETNGDPDRMVARARCAEILNARNVK